MWSLCNPKCYQVAQGQLPQVVQANTAREFNSHRESDTASFLPDLSNTAGQNQPHPPQISKHLSSSAPLPASHCSCSARRNRGLWELLEEQLETLLLLLEVTSHQEGRVLSKHRDDLGLPCDLHCSRAAGTAAVITRRKIPPVFQE